MTDTTDTDTPTSKPTKEAPDDLQNRQFTALGSSDRPDDEPEAAPVLTHAQIIAAAIAAGREVFCLVTKLDSPKRHLDDDTAKRLGDLWGPVCDKHGIDLAKYLGDYALEAGAVIGTLGIGFALVKAVQAEIISKRPIDAKDTAAAGDEQGHHAG